MNLIFNLCHQDLFFSCCELIGEHDLKKKENFIEVGNQCYKL